MSYEGAQTCFKRNCDLVFPDQDPLVWNLNNGLYQLTAALERDLAEIKQELRRLAATMNAR